MTVIDKLRTALTERYRIDREVGVGGMATVYLAHDLRHDRDVHAERRAKSLRILP